MCTYSTIYSLTRSSDAYLSSYSSCTDSILNIKLSAQHSYTDLVDDHKSTVLHLACQHGHKDIVEYLIEQLKMDVGE